MLRTNGRASSLKQVLKDQQLAERGLLRPAALVAETYNAILNRIRSLQIRPDERITIDELVRDLGVSQTPIREALSRLEAEGLVLKTHLVGYRTLAALTRAQVKQLFKLRILLEPYCAARGASRLTDEQKRALRELNDEMTVLAKARSADIVQFVRLDEELHSIVAEASGNAMVAEALSKSHAHVHITRLALRHPLDPEIMAEHSKIVSALNDGDPNFGERAMRSHITASRRRLLGSMAR